MPSIQKPRAVKALRAVMLGILVACGGTDAPATAPVDAPKPEPAPQVRDAGVVNVYSHRHYASDKQLFATFQEQTGIQVRVVKAAADQLIERLASEGESSPADVLITADVGRLWRADHAGLLQSVQSDVLESAIPSHLRHPEGHWFGLTKRARVIVYDRERVEPESLSTYAALTGPEWKGRVLVRSSANLYNQSLLASIVAHEGRAGAKAWAEGVVANFARPPKGSDRDQMKAVAAGIGDVAIVNTYYVGLLVNSRVDAERAIGERMGVFFPNQDGRGAHINISGAGVTAHAPNRDNAVALLEFLVGDDAQRVFASVNYEFPVKPGIGVGEPLASWGDFKADALPLSAVGENQAIAVEVFDEAGWR